MERLGVKVAGVVVTQHKETDRVEEFVTQCEHRGLRVYKHVRLEGYPSELDRIVCESGFGRNVCVETTRDVVVVVPLACKNAVERGVLLLRLSCTTGLLCLVGRATR